MGMRGERGGMPNQSVDVVHDIRNYCPWRPIPAGRIPFRIAARKLRWELLVVCVLVSMYWEVLVPSDLLSFVTIAQNALGLSATGPPGTPQTPSATGALASERPKYAILVLSISRPSQNALMIRTVDAVLEPATVQAQDFKDVEVEASIGRRTLPILYSTPSRFLTAALIPAWSLLVLHLWEMVPALSAALLLNTNLLPLRKKRKTLGLYISL
ncbi:hypothetical protein BV20DRAFT_973242 [Pilatotrama ljubarskyi]|nr:hypothetical protein BV20DRAFT_973242 [Pilatotrama ljubarskyi]